MIGLAFILMHEMDAVRCHEWRIFPGLSLLSDRLGFIIFMWAHVVLYGLLFIFLLNPLHRDAVMNGMSIFFIVHLALHLLFLKHPNNEFTDVHSWLFISGAALFGLLELLNK